jgi:hypothetical protein
MSGNNDPIYSRVGDVSTNATTGMSQPITASAADYTGISANYALVFTADATNGGFVQRLRFKASGTNVPAVMRIFINNGSTPGTATNNAFYGEVSLPATTAATAAATVDIDYPMNFALPAGFRIYAGLGAAVSAGWTVTAIAGKY